MNIRAMLCILVASACVAPVEPACAQGASGMTDGRPYAAERGAAGIRVVETLTLRDKDRGKDLQLRVSWPDTGENWPVIIWSHGAKGTKDMYGPLIEHWVSYGYVCIQANHSDSRAFGLKTDKQATFRDWESRPEDIVFIIDSLGTIEREIGELAGKMDARLIGVGGHSFGAHTAQVIGGARTITPRSSRYTDHSDNRARAFVLLSPQGSGRESLLDEDSWTQMRLPALSITGSNDLGRTGKNWQWRLEPFLNAAPEDKYLLYIDGAYHGFGGIVGFSDFPNAGPEIPDHAMWVKSVTTAFWDAYLLDFPDAWEYLNAGLLARETGGRARILVRGVNDEEIDDLPRAASSPAPGRLGGRGARPGPLPADEIVSRFDRDGDGALSRDEMPPRLARAFDNLDRDGDGVVSTAELESGLSRLR